MELETRLPKFPCQGEAPEVASSLNSNLEKPSSMPSSARMSEVYRWKLASLWHSSAYQVSKQSLLIGTYLYGKEEVVVPGIFFSRGYENIAFKARKGHCSRCLEAKKGCTAASL
jgi:hypothetical protein